MTPTGPNPAQGSDTLSIGGIVAAIAGLIFLPFVLGPVGIVLAWLGLRRGERLGRVALIVSVVALAAGLILYFTVHK